MIAHPDARLVIAERLHRRDRLNGAWWPRSTDITAELPAMLSRAVGRLQVVHGVSLNRDEWPGAPLLLRPFAVNSPKIMWYAAPDARTAVLHCDKHLRVTLLIVPPDTPERVALAAMLMTASPGNTATTSETLQNARTGV